jgi:hypothetical protein
MWFSEVETQPLVVAGEEVPVKTSREGFLYFAF